MTLTSPSEAAGHTGTLDLLMDMELPVMVRFGRTRMALGELMKMTSGSTIEFAPAPQNSVEVVVNGRVVARGEAVVVKGKFGVRITELTAPREGQDAGLASLP